MKCKKCFNIYGSDLTLFTWRFYEVVEQRNAREWRNMPSLEGSYLNDACSADAVAAMPITTSVPAMTPGGKGTRHALHAFQLNGSLRVENSPKGAAGGRSSPKDWSDGDRSGGLEVRLVYRSHPQCTASSYHHHTIPDPTILEPNIPNRTIRDPYHTGT